MKTRSTNKTEFKELFAFWVILQAFLSSMKKLIFEKTKQNKINRQMTKKHKNITHRVHTGMKITWIYRTVLKSPWKLNLPWKALKAVEKALNFTIYRRIQHCLLTPKPV